MKNSVKLRKIGGSQGVVLSKKILRELKMGDIDTLDLEIKDGSIILTPHEDPHEEFDKFFKENPGFESDGMYLDDDENEWDKNEWVW